MRLLLSLPIMALSFFAVDVEANPHGGPHAARHPHDSVARRAPGDVAVHHHKRFSQAKFTFYDAGLGACGEVNAAKDFIVALNSHQYGGGYPGPNCFKKISISYKGKSTVATIMDECPGCPFGGLDFSRGLFTFFAPESVGIIYGEWNFIDGNQNPDPKPEPKPEPKPDPPKPTKTTTKKTPTPTPTTPKKEPSTTPPPPPPPPSTTSSSHSSSSTRSSSSSSHPPTSSSSLSSINYNSGAASNLAVPTGVTISDNVPHNILAMNQAIVAIGGVIVAGGRAV